MRSIKQRVTKVTRTTKVLSDKYKKIFVWKIVFSSNFSRNYFCLEKLLVFLLTSITNFFGKVWEDFSWSIKNCFFRVSTRTFCLRESRIGNFLFKKLFFWGRYKKCFPRDEKYSSCEFLCLSVLGCWKGIFFI